MTKPIDNPFLKQLVANIAAKADAGRINNLSWGTKGLVTEGKKKKSVKEAGNMAPKKDNKPEVTDEPADEKPADDVGPVGADVPKGEPDSAAPGGPDLPPLSKDGEQAPVGDAPADPEEAPEETGADAEADAARAKAELEKAKAEKDKAEKDIKKHSFVHLVSPAGAQFLMGKILGHALETSTVDALASEMVQSLKIQTPEDFSNFSEEVATFMNIPGMAQLMTSMKEKAVKKPSTGEEDPVAESWDPRDAFEDGVSNCCGAPVMMGDICSDCKEHCEVESEEDLDKALEEKIAKL